MPRRGHSRTAQHWAFGQSDQDIAVLRPLRPAHFLAPRQATQRRHSAPRVRRCPLQRVVEISEQPGCRSMFLSMRACESSCVAALICGSCFAMPPNRKCGRTFLLVLPRSRAIALGGLSRTTARRCEQLGRQRQLTMRNFACSTVRSTETPVLTIAVPKRAWVAASRHGSASLVPRPAPSGKRKSLQWHHGLFEPLGQLWVGPVLNSPNVRPYRSRRCDELREPSTGQCNGCPWGYLGCPQGCRIVFSMDEAGRSATFLPASAEGRDE